MESLSGVFNRLVKFRRGERNRYEDLQGDDRLRSPSQVEFQSVPVEGTPSTPGSARVFPEGE